MPKIAIVDSDLRLRNEVLHFLSSRGLVIEAFDSAESFLQFRPEIACLVVDLDLEGMSGARLHDHLMTEDDTTSIIVSTKPTAVSDVVAAMNRGALTVLEKPYPLAILHDFLLRGIEVASARKRILDERQSLAERIRTLTQREREVFELLLAGMHVKQIGLVMGIGIKTVHTFRTQLMNKLGFESNVELVRRIAMVFGSEGIERFSSSADEKTLLEMISSH